ncbi:MULTISPECIES: hypothetical protein [Cereibacter]|uniref:Uncharacterized protein n=1 Tax=Cereibacter johrii TaxID=445629 RepID=A0ABX5J8B8_9RHOB|nr:MULTISPECIES: hypothetical protein [Cereibacter]EKX56618.1 hypothetical protein D516_2795 [Rhodobacter sp. AKP1]RDS93902.1 hypothetical protein DWF04_22410 [Cereibacter sphaeroides f. sp. denitrificans]MEA5159630.1 hypothetical protein [Cereibacter johrii]PTM79399.1 hypothetical protein C8J29_103500 [Cereibacter johrii]QCP86690.1 hypothetical protein EYE35_13645 [Cereibacter sphaeroides]
MKHDPRPMTAAQAAETVPAYFTPERNTRQLRNLSALEQMYGYYNRD